MNTINRNNNAMNNAQPNQYNKKHPTTDALDIFAIETVTKEAIDKKLNRPFRWSELIIKLRGHLIETESNAPWFNIFRNLNTKAVVELHRHANALGHEKASKEGKEYTPMPLPDLSVFKPDESLFITERKCFYTDTHREILHKERPKVHTPYSTIHFTPVTEDTQGSGTLGDVPDSLLALIDLGK